jgi:hypothetical protein
MGDGRADAARLVRDWPLVVRRARASDEAAVLSFASETWDGWDYIPHAWPVWLAATDGVMLVATRPDDDTPIALTRVALVSPTDGWWEGIRVDPELRGMEVAADLQVAELHWSAALGARVIRYATSARNEGSHRLGARHGVNLLFAYRNYWWSPDEGDPHEPSAFDADVRAAASELRSRVLETLASEGRVVSAADTSRTWAFVAGDAGFQAAQRLYEPRPWALGELSAERFVRHVQRGEVITAGDRAVAILLRDQLAGEDSSLRLALLVGEIDAMLELLAAVRAAGGDKTLRFRLAEVEPLTATTHDRLTAAGYQSGDWSLHILGRPIDAANPVPEIDPTRLVLADEPGPIVTPLDF